MVEKPDLPIIIKNSKIFNNKPLLALNVLNNLPKIVFIFLALVILMELIVGLWFLTRPTQSSLTSKTSFFQKPQASITLSANQKEVSLGNFFIVNITLGVNGRRTVGSDLVIRYDPKLLQIEGLSKEVFVPGKQYPEYIGEKIDNNNGVFRISGIANVVSNSLDSNFGSLRFKAKAKGKASINIDFQPGHTADSNVIDEKTSRDILNQVNNLEVTID